jgi:DNA modification methylase
VGHAGRGNAGAAVTGRALVVQADALRLPLPDESVDLVICSPPYWQLRTYDAPNAIGLEATPAEYVELLWQATAEMARVLKPSGSIFVNLADKYNSSSHHMQGISSTVPRTNPIGAHPNDVGRLPVLPMVGLKSLIGLPWRYALGCIDQLGLILRRDLIWQKVNSLPESVTDRARSSHEYIFHLTKSPRYYSALDTLREPHTAKPQRRLTPHKAGALNNEARDGGWQGIMRDQVEHDGHSLGKLPGSVWSIPSHPLDLPAWLGVDHYAAFPPELPRRLILGWSPPGICLECGEGRRPVVDRQRDASYGQSRRGKDAHRHNGDAGWGMDVPGAPVYRTEATILGWACSCTPFTDHPGTGGYRGPEFGHADDFDGYPNVGVSSPAGGTGHLGNRPRVGPWREYHLDGWTPPPTRPAVVLDPFGGTGTTAMVARALGRYAFSFDLSHAYSRAAQYRVFKSGDWQQVIERTTGRKARPMPRYDPAQERLDLFAAAELLDPGGEYRKRAAWHQAQERLL